MALDIALHSAGLMAKQRTYNCGNVLCEIYLKVDKRYIREARVVTTRTIPVQVDGEAVRLNPCTIEITHLNKVWIQIDQSDATSDVLGSDPGQEEGKKEDV